MNRFNQKLPGNAFAVATVEKNSTKRKETATKNQHRASRSFENLSARIVATMYVSPMREIIALYFVVNSAKKIIGNMAI